jgi:hypothetical protein
MMDDPIDAPWSGNGPPKRLCPRGKSTETATLIFSTAG